ncbi:hypothetical protein JKI95_11845 [Corynebacterium aquatimens]|nr:hypothetical protein JKI95_11845 [Corynebacterium aquatimens]UIZ93361.1 hypothetical protein JZY91_06140 [Corynebacterium sp. CNCTC7651]
MLFGFDNGGASISKGTYRVAPAEDAPAGELRKVEQVSETMWKVTVWSPSMGKEIVNDVISPAGGPDNATPRPTYYILGGAGGTPFTQYEGIPEFFKGKNVNVVSPYGTRGTMATDWREPHPELGETKWATYMSRELPPVIDALFHGTGRDAIAGASAHGGSALTVATLSDRFVAAGTYSSCPSTSGIVGGPFAQIGVRFYKGDPKQMWGSPLSEVWNVNSPVNQIEQLRGKKLFLTASRGIHSEFDDQMTDSPDFLLVPDEQLAYVCSHHFMKRADKRGVDYDWYELYEGTHNLGTFQRELPLSWQTIGPALGVE